VIEFHDPDGDLEDVRDAEDAVAEPGESVPAEQLWADLGLSDAGGETTGEDGVPS
jgi:hypothetical protein